MGGWGGGRGMTHEWVGEMIAFTKGSGFRGLMGQFTVQCVCVCVCVCVCACACEYMCVRV